MKTQHVAFCLLIAVILISKQTSLAQSAWLLSGNTSTNTDKLGSLNAVDLKIITNNQRRMTIKSTGRVGIGITNPICKLDVNGSLNLAFDSGITSGGAKILSTYFSGQNLFIGYHAGDSNHYINSYQGAHNTFVGTYAGQSNTYGANNAYFGNGAGLYSRGNANTFIGFGAGEYCQTGNNNVAIGNNAGFQNPSGSYNCLVGDSAGWGSGGIGNVYIGHKAGAPQNAALSNSAAIGIEASVTASNSMMFGNSSVKFWGFGITTPVASQALKVGSSSSNGNGAYLTIGGVWTDISDRRKKDNITQVDKEDILNKIIKLGVTKWKYKGSSDEYHIGPMADDFYDLFKVGNDSSTSAMDKTGVLFLGLKALIEKEAAMQSALNEQQAQIEKQQQQIEELKQMLQARVAGTSNALSKNNLTGFNLEQNVPNPFTHTTSVRYNIPSNVKNALLMIRNITGETIKQLPLQAGTGTITVDASSLSNGTYNYCLFIDGKLIENKKMIVAH